MNEELLSSMTFTPEKCINLGEVQEISFKPGNIKDDIEDTVQLCNIEMNLSIDKIYDLIGYYCGNDVRERLFN